MNLYLRLMWLLMSTPLRRPLGPLDVAVTRWRVLPGDLDALGHMTNARYLAIMDLARVDLVVRLGLAKHVIARRWQIPVRASSLAFRAPLRPFESYEVHTRILAWDAACFYVQQDFLRAGDPVASGLVKVAFVDRAGVVASRDVLATGWSRTVACPPLHDEVRSRLDGVPSPVRVAPLPVAAREPLAIVGIGCRLPGGIANPDELWQALLDERDCIVEIPASRWSGDRFYDPTGSSPGRSYVHRAGLLADDPRSFDAGFFSINPREAETLDPQQRLLLHASWEAFEHAGIAADSLAGTATGVYVGGFTVDNLVALTRPENRDRITSATAIAGTLTMLSNRLSYFYDLRGPSLTVDTACSSSLVALHLACQALWSGEITTALVGGVNVLLVPELHVMMAKGRFLSPRGRCHAFSAEADGYVRAEGASVIVVKPLASAVRDGNPVIAVIRGTAANQDGRTPGITMPDAEAQIAVMHAAYRAANVDPSTVAYVEAHGTGTAAGDPVEARALGAVVGAGRTHPCAIGSIKTNLGHTEAASGLTGVIKAALVLAHREVPVSLHSQPPNPNISFDALGLHVADAVTPLTSTHPAIAAVNSFGYGGTNAHVVLAEAPRVQAAVAPLPRPAVLPLSARSPEALAALAGRYATWLDAGGDPDALCRTAGANRSHHRHRAAWHGGDTSTLAGTLHAIARGDGGASVAQVPEHAAKPAVVFVFTGMGPQWWGMGRELARTEAVFRDALAACDALFHERAGFSIAHEMARDAETSRITRTELAQPANVVLQIALARLLASWGIVPDGVLGHSVGEVAAAHIAGSLDLRDTMALAFHRSRLQARLAGTGGMLAVGLTRAELEARVGGWGSAVSLAAHNGPRSMTLAGERDALEKVARGLAADGVFHRFLQVEVPYHSALMAPIEDELRSSLRELAPRPPDRPIFSTVTGARLHGVAHGAEYWWRNVREPVAFEAAVVAATRGDTLFVEVGPHPVLAASLREIGRDSGASIDTISTLLREQPERAALAQTVARLYAHGQAIDWRAYAGEGTYVAIPTYPWQLATPWAEAPSAARLRVREPGHPLLERGAHVNAWIADLNLGGADRFLLDHVVGGAAIFPAAGYLELVLAARTAATGTACCSIENLTLEHPVTLDPEVRTRLEIASSDARVTIDACSGEAAPIRVAHASVYGVGRPGTSDDLAVVRDRVTCPIEIAQLYADLAAVGLAYGPAFRAVRAAWGAADEILAELVLGDELDEAGFAVHPVLLDAALHSLLAAAASEHAGATIVPRAIERVQWFSPPGRRVFAHGRLRHIRGQLHGELSLFTSDGARVMEVSGLVCEVLRAPDPFALRAARWWSTRRYEPIALSAEQATARPWFLEDRAMRPATVRAAVARTRCLVDLRWWSSATPQAPIYAAALDAAALLVETVQALEVGCLDRYVLVVRHAEMVTSDDEVDVTLAPLIGVCRTVMTERPDLRLTVIDLDGDLDRDQLEAWLARLGDEQELAIRRGEPYAARLVPCERPIAEPPPQVELHGTSFEVAGLDRGRLDAVRFDACTRRAPGPGEVEIEVAYCPLGFKDVMKALGALPPRALGDTYFGDALGMEAVGHIVAAGEGVRDLVVGDRVYAAAPGCLRSHVIAHASKVVTLPDQVPATAALNTINFMTAYAGLIEVARLSAGDWVLIHGASGGVGQAAIEVARWRGAHIIATAGSPEKRAHLAAQGIVHVTGSRDLGFADDVARWTAGRGVDVVLNFSPGEIVSKGLACLAPMGRFIEIGKMSFVPGSRLELEAFNRGLTYAALDFDRALASHPETVMATFREVVARLAAGDFAPTPVAIVGASQLASALRSMARGKHVGKVAIAMADRELRGNRLARPRFAADATYVVTGGLRGFGLEVSHWLVDHGARNLALLTRTGAEHPEAAAALVALRERGVDARVWRVDVGDPVALTAAWSELVGTMPAVRGVFHAATVYADRPLATLDRGTLDEVLRVKAGGALTLHHLVRDLAIEHFVLFSSVSSVIGNAGQANYVAANNLLDQLALARRREGSPALAVQWGALADTGVVARDGMLARHLAALGLRGLSSIDALACLGDALDAGLTQIAIVDADWRKIRDGLPPGAGRARLAQIVPEVDRAGDGLAHMRGVDDAATLALVVEHISSVIGEVMRMPADKVDHRTPLRDIGIDSLMALEIAVGIENRLQIPVSAMMVAAGPAPVELASALLARDSAGAEVRA